MSPDAYYCTEERMDIQQKIRHTLCRIGASGIGRHPKTFLFYQESKNLHKLTIIFMSGEQGRTFYQLMTKHGLLYSTSEIYAHTADTAFMCRVDAHVSTIPLPLETQTYLSEPWHQ